MSDDIELYLLLFILCLLLSAFFSSSETAFVALQRIRVKHMVENNVKGARRVARMIERPEKLLSTILLGNNFVNVAAAALGTAVAIELWGDQGGVLIATVGVTVLLLIFAETTPKTFATQHPERLSLIFARPIELIAWLFTPFVITLSWIASEFTRLIGGRAVPRSLASEEEIRTMISVGHKEGTMEEAEAEMLHKVFEFGDRPVREVMVPRPEVIAIEQGSKMGDFLTLYTEFPLSRFPVYQENMDNVVGILSVKDVLMAQAKGTITARSTIDELVRPPYFTPETKRINELFTEMRDKNYRMCVVVDEFGGTAGIASLTRLVEEIVGPVGDELAEVEKEYEVINEYTFQIDGSMRIEEANEEMELELPEGAYETVAGFVLHLLGYIPKLNEQLRYKGSKLVITEMRGLKIEKILLTKEKQPGPGAAGPARDTGEASRD
ncbi:MAG: hemolysin [Dehalococcoidales bacterium]|jgi:putative hemolysin|nr:hemolysin [Dehalococcoidales bacterium]MDP6577382.1 hemolysin family protein [Dehalococcoidales bacterium]